LEETWQHLESQGEKTPRGPDGRPFVPDQMPSYDDKEPGFFYFQCRLEDADNSNLTLPRTYFGNAYFVRVSFADTDLSESSMCWNEFDDCDFSGAGLTGCDMRMSYFCRCRFVGAVLRDADLRRSKFEDCDFTGADLTGAVSELEDFPHHARYAVSDAQKAVMFLTWDGGELPFQGPV
jgi:hypothetical protein